MLSLWIVLFLSLFSLAMARRASLESTLSGHALQDQSMAGLARGKALDVARALTLGEQEEEGLTEEESRVNVNRVNLEGLERLFGGEKEVAAAVMDWRDADDKTTPGGAERGDYSTRLPYTCRNAPFQFPEELLLVKGMTRELYDQAAPHLTLWGDGRVNWNKASTRVFEILGLPAEDARALVDFRLGPDGAPGTEDDRVFSEPNGLFPLLEKEVSLSDDGKAALLVLLAKNGFSFKGQYVRWQGVLSEEGLPGSRAMTLVLAPMSDPGKILLWREEQ